MLLCVLATAPNSVAIGNRLQQLIYVLHLFLLYSSIHRAIQPKTLGGGANLETNNNHGFLAICTTHTKGIACHAL